MVICFFEIFPLHIYIHLAGCIVDLLVLADVLSLSGR